jgi:hypothetical protein
MGALRGIFVLAILLCGGCRVDAPAAQTSYDADGRINRPPPDYVYKLTGDLKHGIALVSVSDDGDSITTCFTQTRLRRPSQYSIGYIGLTSPSSSDYPPEECFTNKFQRQGQTFDYLHALMRQHFPCFPNTCVLDSAEPTVDAMSRKLDEFKDVK